MDIVQMVWSVGLGVVVSAMLLAVAWSLFDVVFRASDISLPQRILWVALLLGLSVLAAALYVRIGPGRSRWYPWRWWSGVRTGPA